MYGGSTTSTAGVNATVVLRMALTHEQRIAIVNSTFDRAEKGEPPLIRTLAEESRERRKQAARTDPKPGLHPTVTARPLQ